MLIFCVHEASQVLHTLRFVIFVHSCSVIYIFTYIWKDKGRINSRDHVYLPPRIKYSTCLNLACFTGEDSLSFEVADRRTLFIFRFE